MKKIIIISVLVMGTFELFAQVPPPPTVPPPSANVPLDPFSWVVLGAGGLATAGKYYKNRFTKK